MTRSTQGWTLDTLKHELTRRELVKGWIVSQEHVHRRERYFMLDGPTLVTDQDREVRSQSIHAKIFVRLGKPGRQGEISKKLFPSLPLGPQLDSAIEAALQTDHQAWSLPESLPKDVPQVTTTDPRMAEDLERVMGELTGKIGIAVARRRATVFNSAELFLSVHDHETHLSNGLVHRSSQSRIYSEAAYSYSRRGNDGRMLSDEYLNTRWAVNLDDIAIEQLFDETSERAEHSLDVTKPRTGRYPVIVDADVLAALFASQLTQLSSMNAYHGLPFVKPGDELVPKATGDLLTITLDPTVPYGADTAALSEHGLVQSPFRLVDSNRVIATATDKRFADYLSVAPTTVRGNIVVAPGTLSQAELAKQGPQVIEILQFSGLFVDANSGTFGSEIRLARLHDNERKTITYLKGGSLSGSFRENFRGARLSSRAVKRAHFSSGGSTGEGYFGPEFALLSDVSIVG
ncbi:MAG: metallopeptidase TldD-related protein [Oligoflexia bacterium]|nr:metallopeptidase TldD-related protein [Oligoflexia bacterium]